MTYLFVNNQEIKNEVGNPISVSKNTTINSEQNPISVEETRRFEASSRSSFGEPISVPITPTIQMDALYGLPTRDFEVFSASTGTAGTTGTLFQVETGVSPGGYGVVRSRKILRYRPGQGALCRFTAAYSTPHVNTTQRAGLFAQEQALNIGYNGTQFGILRQNGGKATIYDLEITSAVVGANQTFTITLNSVPYTVVVPAGDITEVATTVAQASFPGWLVEQTGSNICFLSASVSVQAGVYSYSSSGAATASLTEIQTGVAHTDNWIYQEDWNIDTLDGNGHSGVTIDYSKLNIFQIQFRWLGAGEIRFAIEDPITGDMIFFHHIHYSNRNTDVHLDNPSFKLGYIAANLSGNTVTNSKVTGGSMMGAIEGLRGSSNYPTSIACPTKSSLNSNTVHHLLTIKNKLIYTGKINLKQNIAKKVSVSFQGQDPAEVLLILNSTPSVPLVYNNVSTVQSCSAYSTTTATFVEANELLLAVYILSPDSVGIFDLEDLGISIPNNATLSIAIQSAQAVQSVKASLIWEEI